MLILSRNANESILIGDSIVITVVRVIGDKVRIGIEAPAEMKVLRTELTIRSELSVANTSTHNSSSSGGV